LNIFETLQPIALAAILVGVWITILGAICELLTNIALEFIPMAGVADP
jgi:flagellar biosynthesis protein FliQ